MCITGLQKLSRLMSHHGRGQHLCPLCDLEGPQLQALSVPKYIVDHQKGELNVDCGGVVMRRPMGLHINCAELTLVFEL